MYWSGDVLTITSAKKHLLPQFLFLQIKCKNAVVGKSSQKKRLYRNYCSNYIREAAFQALEGEQADQTGDYRGGHAP